MNLKEEGIIEIPKDSARKLKEDLDQYSDPEQIAKAEDTTIELDQPLESAFFLSMNTLPYRPLSPP